MPKQLVAISQSDAGNHWIDRLAGPFQIGMDAPRKLRRRSVEVENFRGAHRP